MKKYVLWNEIDDSECQYDEVKVHYPKCNCKEIAKVRETSTPSEKGYYILKQMYRTRGKKPILVPNNNEVMQEVLSKFKDNCVCSYGLQDDEYRNGSVCVIGKNDILNQIINNFSETIELKKLMYMKSRIRFPSIEPSSDEFMDSDDSCGSSSDDDDDEVDENCYTGWNTKNKYTFNYNLSVFSNAMSHQFSILPKEYGYIVGVEKDKKGKAEILNLPSGKRRFFETSEAAAFRELWEETNIILDEKILSPRFQTKLKKKLGINIDSTFNRVNYMNTFLVFLPSKVKVAKINSNIFITPIKYQDSVKERFNASYQSWQEYEHEH